MLLEPPPLERARVLDLDPAQALAGDRLDVRLAPLRRRRGRGKLGAPRGPSQPGLREVRHRSCSSHTRRRTSAASKTTGPCARERERLVYCAATYRHIERGGGTGPKKPRQPPRKGKGANSSRWICLEDVSESPNRTSAHSPAEVFSQVDIQGDGGLGLESLRCKECGAEYPLDARYVCEQCFGPLEVAYDHSGVDAAEAKRKIQAGSRGIWRYSDFLPFEGGPPATRSPLEPGLTPMVRADRLAERLGLREVWVKNDAAN